MQRRLGLDLEVSDEFGYFLAGFSAGEACFYARIRCKKEGFKRLVLAYFINLRADDGPALQYIQRTLGIGRIYRHGVDLRLKRPNPQFRYIVYRAGDLYHVIVPLFDEYRIPLEFKKAAEFKIWRKLVEIHYLEGGSGIPLPKSYWAKIEPLVDELKRARIFVNQDSRS